LAVAEAVEDDITVDAPSEHIDPLNDGECDEVQRVLHEIGNELTPLAEVTDFQAYAGTASPINFNGLVRQYYLRSAPEQGDIQVNLVDKHERARKSHQIAASVRGPLALTHGDAELALLAARIIAYAQGFRILAAASETYGWALDFARIAEIWRAGCIIRSALLDDISAAFRSDMPHGQLIFAPAFAKRLQATIPALRRVTAAAIASGHPVPALSASLGFIDTMAQARGTTDLVQAQRDFFGRHGFERIGGAAGSHGPWWD